MDVTIAESEIPLSVKGRGTQGVSYSDGVNTVVLARLRNGRLGQLCRYCNGDGMYTPSSAAAEKKFGKSPCAGGCQGTGIRRVYADDQTALEAATRFLRHRSMSTAERQVAYAAEQEAWYAEHADLVAAATRHAHGSRTLRDLLRHLKVGEQMFWTAAQTRTAVGIISQIENPPPSRHAGSLGRQITFTGIVERTATTRQYGKTKYTVVIAGDGECAEAFFSMHGISATLAGLCGQEGLWVQMAAAVKEHGHYLGRAETRVSNPRLLASSEEQGVDRSSWPGTLTFTGRDGAHTLLKVRDGDHARSLLLQLFTGLRYGMPASAELSWAGRGEPMTFLAEQVLADDVDGAYAALLELDEPSLPEPTPVVAGSRRCAVDGCTRDRKCAGLCGLHYGRRCRGMPNWDEPAPMRAIPKDGCCGHGHPRTPANTSWTSQGTRRCVVCMKEDSSLRRAATRAGDAQALKEWLQ